MSTMIIEARGVSKSYVCPSETVTPIRGLDLQVLQGDFVLIYGQSGSGKTTLLNLLAGIDSVDEGLLSFEGERYDRKSDLQLTRMRRDHLGVIFQSFELVSVMSCFENIEYPLILQGAGRTERKKRVEAMAALLGIGNLLRRKPELVSGGQRQRVAICRALVGDYRLILGDEITGNLDPDNSDLVYDLLGAMNRNQGRTFVMVTHNRDLKKYATKVYRLKNGALVEEQP